MKKLFKTLLSIVLFSLFVVNVDAATLKEDSSTYDGDIYIIGTTKFDGSKVITAAMIKEAAENDLALQNLISEYFTSTSITNEVLPIYYFNNLDTKWSTLPETITVTSDGLGNVTTTINEGTTDENKLLTATETSAVESKNIYYNDNEVKKLTYTYVTSANEDIKTEDITTVNSEDNTGASGVSYDKTTNTFTVDATVIAFNFGVTTTEVTKDTNGDDIVTTTFQNNSLLNMISVSEEELDEDDIVVINSPTIEIVAEDIYSIAGSDAIAVSVKEKLNDFAIYDEDELLTREFTVEGASVSQDESGYSILFSKPGKYTLTYSISTEEEVLSTTTKEIEVLFKPVATINAEESYVVKSTDLTNITVTETLNSFTEVTSTLLLNDVEVTKKNDGSYDLAFTSGNNTITYNITKDNETLFTTSKTVAVEFSDVIVTNLSELTSALNNQNITEITFGANIAAGTTPLFVNNSVTIKGNNKILSFGSITTPVDGSRSGLVLQGNNTKVSELTVNMTQVDGWQGNYAVQVYNATGVELENITMTSADAGLLVNASEVMLKGNIALTDNSFGGIEVSKGVADGLSNSTLTIDSNATIIMNNEEITRPVLWVVRDSAETSSVQGTVNTNNKISGPYAYDEVSKHQDLYYLDSTLRTSVTVSNFTELTAALSDQYVTDITLTDDIDAGDSTLSVTTSVTIDLNGNDFNGSINVEGDLTIEGDGTFTGKAGTNAFFVDEDATLTINGGNYITSYNIGFINGGTIVINDGTFTCDDICFSGNANGEYKDFNMTINGGTFTSARGYNIYIPNPGTLTVNGGTLNGGIMYRMATVNINGGEIYGSASTSASDYDSYLDYYGYSGMPWFGDAITIIGGTYEKPAASTATNTNPELNVTDGTIASNNEVGTALAVLNLGKVEATPSINISGGTFSTNASRDTFEILNSTDVNATDAYKANNNHISTTITGGEGLTGVTNTGDYWNTTTLYVNEITQY